MTMDRAYFEHIGGYIEDRPPVEAYEMEADYLLSRLPPTGGGVMVTTLRKESAQFAATARKLRWQAGVNREHREKAA